MEDDGGEKDESRVRNDPATSQLLAECRAKLSYPDMTFQQNL